MVQARVRLILFEDMPSLEPYDQDRWLNSWMRERETFAQTLECLRVLRESTVRLFRATPESDLRRTGVHRERSVQAAGDYIILVAGHDINHLSQIEGIRTRLIAA